MRPAIGAGNDYGERLPPPELACGGGEKLPRHRSELRSDPTPTLFSTLRLRCGEVEPRMRPEVDSSWSPTIQLCRCGGIGLIARLILNHVRTYSADGQAL